MREGRSRTATGPRLPGSSAFEHRQLTAGEQERAHPYRTGLLRGDRLVVGRPLPGALAEAEQPAGLYRLVHHADPGLLDDRLVVGGLEYAVVDAPGHAVGEHRRTGRLVAG